MSILSYSFLLFIYLFIFWCYFAVYFRVLPVQDKFPCPRTVRGMVDDREKHGPELKSGPGI